MKILIVDDDFISRKLLLKILESYGECDLACNGKEAWEAFQNAHVEERKYDIILLDIMMPEMDGREVLRHIRGYEQTKQLPSEKIAHIAMATTLADKVNVIQAFRDQCDGYITKPYTRESLLADLRKFSMLPE